MLGDDEYYLISACKGAFFPFFPPLLFSLFPPLPLPLLPLPPFYTFFFSFFLFFFLESSSNATIRQITIPCFVTESPVIGENPTAALQPGG